MPAINSWSVTSNAGLKILTFSGAMRFSYHISAISSGLRSSMTISSPVAVAISIVDVGAQIYTGTLYCLATAATTDVPILFAVSPLAATRSHPTNTAFTQPFFITIADILSQISVVSTPDSCNSNAVNRAPCKRGLVSSQNTCK